MDRFRQLIYFVLLTITAGTLGIATQNNRALAVTATPPPPVTPTPIAPVDIQFKGIETLVIYGLHYPAPQQPAPTVLLLHGGNGSKEDWSHWAPLWAARGFNVFAIDYRGFGQTGGTSDNAKTDQDIQLVLKQIGENPLVVPHQIGIVGASLGAPFGLVACAKAPDCQTVILLSPNGYKGDLENPIKTLGTRSALFMSSELDPMVTVVQDYAKRAMGEHMLIVTEGKYHALELLDSRPELANLIGDWLVRYLLDRANAAATMSGTP